VKGVTTIPVFAKMTPNVTNIVRSFFLDIAQISGVCPVKKRLAIFPSPAGMLLTKLSLGGNHFIIPAQGEFG
jgi:hypothetical protein